MDKGEHDSSNPLPKPLQSSEARDRLRAALAIARAENLKPPPVLTVSGWADEYRRLSPEASAEPGRWRTDRAEYQRGIMDAVSDPDVETVVVMSSAQVGKTEVVNNTVGFYISQDPAPILVLQPTLEMAQAWSKDRLAPMLRDTPILQGSVKDPKGRDSGNTLLHKTFAGGHITMAGANSPASLASRPIRILLCDEIDRYPVSAGTEGDPVNLGAKRTITFWNRKKVLVSTPTVKGASRIETAFENSDQRRFFIPCPHCDEFDYLRWANVDFDKEKPEDAAIVCESCGGVITDEDRKAAIHNGEWRSTAEGPPGVAGFHLNELYSPWRNLADIVRDFLEAKDSPERLRTWVNTSLGETWEDEQGEQVDPHWIANRREPYEGPPVDVLLLVASVDVQDDRLEIEVVGYGQGEESWGVETFVFWGDPGKPELWNQLDDYLLRTWERADGIQLAIAATGIDTGGHYTQQVYNFVKRSRARRVFALKGMAGNGRPLVGRPSKSNRGKVPLFTVGTDTAKELLLLSRLKTLEPGPGYCHFPVEYDDEYFDQLTAEKAVIKYHHGHPSTVWVKTRPRNEALDLRVYSLATLAILNPNFDRLERRLNDQVENLTSTQFEGDEVPPPGETATPTRPTRRAASRKRGGGFVHAWKQ